MMSCPHYDLDPETPWEALRGKEAFESTYMRARPDAAP